MKNKMENKIEFYNPHNKETYLKRNWPFGTPASMHTKVSCMHCKDVYPMGEYKVKKVRNLWGKSEGNIIVCKNHEKCGGNAFDLIIPDVVEPLYESERILRIITK